MNNYQVQQLNDTITFATSVLALGFVVSMVGIIRPFSGEEPNRIWLVYVTKEGKWGATDVTPKVPPSLHIHRVYFKEYVKEVAEVVYYDAEAQVRAGRFVKYWISEAPTKYKAIKNVQAMALPEHHSNEFKFGRRSIRDVLENPKEDEYYVLVTRYYPIEFRRQALKLKETSIDEWDRDLAPSPELLGWWKEGLRTRERWEEYTRGFLEEVPSMLIREKAGVYKERAQERKVVFVCEEEDWEYPYCHTWILLNVLKEEGKETRGYQ